MTDQSTRKTKTLQHRAERHTRKLLARKYHGKFTQSENFDRCEECGKVETACSCRADKFQRQDDNLQNLLNLSKGLAALGKLPSQRREAARRGL